jgi:lysine 2,3-aminomutase
VFLPKIIIIDSKGNHIETTNRTKLPLFEKLKKSELLGYTLYDKDMPLTNPAEIFDELEENFKRSSYYKLQQKKQKT